MKNRFSVLAENLFFFYIAKNQHWNCWWKTNQYEQCTLPMNCTQIRAQKPSTRNFLKVSSTENFQFSVDAQHQEDAEECFMRTPIYQWLNIPVHKISDVPGSSHCGVTQEAVSACDHQAVQLSVTESTAPGLTLLVSAKINTQDLYLSQCNTMWNCFADQESLLNYLYLLFCLFLILKGGTRTISLQGINKVFWS